METSEIRRDNLRRLTEALDGGQAELAAHLNKSPAQINQWIGKNPTRNISARAARQIESLLGIPEYALDKETAPKFDVGILAECIAHIDKLVESAELEGLTPRDRAVAIIVEYESRKSAAKPKTSDVIPFSNASKAR